VTTDLKTHVHFDSTKTASGIAVTPAQIGIRLGVAKVQFSAGYKKKAGAKGEFCYVVDLSGYRFSPL